MSEMKMTDAELRLAKAMSRVAEKCVKCQGDWSWLDAVRCCEHRLLILFRRTVHEAVRKAVDETMGEKPSAETICEGLNREFIRILWPRLDEAQRTAFETWILTLALKSFSNDKASAIAVSDDDDEESEKDEGERVDNGSSPMSYDSRSPVDHDHVSSSPPHPPAEMTPEAKPVAEPVVQPPSISLGASVAAAEVSATAMMMDDDDDKSVPSSPPPPAVDVHAPRRSPSQTEADEKLQAAREAQGIESVVVPSFDGGAAASEPQPVSQDPVEAYARAVSPAQEALVDQEIQEDKQRAAAAAVLPDPRGSKVRPNLPEPASRTAQTKRRKVVRMTADRGISAQASPARSTRSSDKKTRSGHPFPGLAD